MRKSTAILFVTLICFGLIDTTPAKEVTHDEIKGTIQSLVYSYNQLDNKLERHEHRERALGELMKKAMLTLQKGQKSLEPMTEIFSRLDERVSQIETMLMAQEEKYNIQTDKLGEALENMFKWMNENNECFKRPPSGSVSSSPTPSFDSEFMSRQQQTNKELIDEMKKLSSKVESLLATSKDVLSQTQEAYKNVPSADEVIHKIEDKFVSFYITPAVTPAPAPLVIPKDNSEFENKVYDSFNQIAESIKELATMPKNEPGLTIRDKEFIQSLSNETLSALENVKVDALSASDKVLAKTASRIKESEENIQGNVNKVYESISESADILEKFYTEMNSSYSSLSEGLEIFNKFNKILLANSEYVLDTQRKVEYGTHQVIMKVSDILEAQKAELSAIMLKRFDDIDESIVNNHLEALQNLSSTIESEISHVWHQIEIMHSEITDSKDTLNKLQGQTQEYVNGTVSTMDSMEGKVSQITSRMMEVDSNLNYLLGRLSLISQEFNNIKIGLGTALDQIRGSFHAVQEKIAKQQQQQQQQQQGPGPHSIPQSEYETELNLLSKRNAL